MVGLKRLRTTSHCKVCCKNLSHTHDTFARVQACEVSVVFTKLMHEGSHEGLSEPFKASEGSWLYS